MSSPPGVLIREMSLADIPSGLGLCRASRWNQTERDWQSFLTTAPHGALVAVENGRVIGSVATLPYGPFAWISMVLVDPAARRRGLGTLLLNRGLALIPDRMAARLDATPAGEVLYRKLGFAAEYGLARLFLDVPASPKQSDRRACLAEAERRRETTRRSARDGCATAHPHRLAGHSRDGRARVRRIAGQLAGATRRRGSGVRLGCRTQRPAARILAWPSWTSAGPSRPADCRDRRDRRTASRCVSRGPSRSRGLHGCTGRSAFVARRARGARVRDRAPISSHASRPAHRARAAVAGLRDHWAGIRLTGHPMLSKFIGLMCEYA